MSTQVTFSLMLISAGLTGMLIGAVDALEGSFFILLSIALATVGAWIGKSRYRTLLNWSTALVAIGVATLVVLTWLGGIGGNSGRSMWWAVTILPYPIGWVLGLVGTTLAIAESCKRRSTVRHSARWSLR